MTTPTLFDSNDGGEDQPGAIVWEGWDQVVVPDPDDPITSLTAAERADADPGEFWKARPVLAHIFAFARARRVGPWAVLGATLARVIASVPPEIQFPPLIGGRASLNLMVGLVGPSGMGKDAAQKVAAEAVAIQLPPFVTNPIGSGEGLAKMFMRSVRASAVDPHPEPEMFNRACLVTIGEIDTFSAITNRQASTLMPQLRQAAMGEQLGFHYADETKRMMVPEHRYRLCLIAGIQPARSGVLLDDADGGTPQRFVWLPAGDPEAPDMAPPEPTPMLWQSPDWERLDQRIYGTQVARLIPLPTSAREAMDRARVQRLRQEGDALDSHALLTRAKVAAALAILEGMHKITEEDWQLSGVVMAMSDHQRQLCQDTLAAAAAKRNKGQAEAEATRAVVIKERTEEAEVVAVVKWARRKLADMGPTSHSELRRKCPARRRDHFDDAMDRLISTGEVVVDESVRNTQQKITYRLA
jgi:hypothetical protein